MSDSAIACRAIFSRAQTLADGTWRLSFDLEESDSARVAQISALRGSVLFLTVIPEAMAEMADEGQ